MAQRNAKRSNRPNPREERAPKTLTKATPLALIPRSLNQEKMLDALENTSTPIVVATGPAGSGKTFLATLFAIRELKAGNISKIILSRPNIAVDDNDIGFLPGDIIEKMKPWCGAIFDTLTQYYNHAELEHLIKEEVISFLPIAFCRGRTISNAICLLDEAQSTTPNSLLAMMTRIGYNAKLIITGDTEQTDRGSTNGLSDFMDRYNRIGCEGISIVQFAKCDVQRHAIIPSILTMYGKNSD